jgi:hypothetical protein
MEELIRRGRAWMPVAKAAALFVLPLPLVFAVLVDLFGGELGHLALTSAALASLWTAGTLTWRALVAEARYFLGQRLDPPRP